MAEKGKPRRTQLTHTKTTSIHSHIKHTKHTKHTQPFAFLTTVFVCIAMALVLPRGLAFALAAAAVVAAVLVTMPPVVLGGLPANQGGALFTSSGNIHSLFTVEKDMAKLLREFIQDQETRLHHLKQLVDTMEHTPVPPTDNDLDPQDSFGLLHRMVRCCCWWWCACRPDFSTFDWSQHRCLQAYHGAFLLLALFDLCGCRWKELHTCKRWWRVTCKKKSSKPCQAPVCQTWMTSRVHPRAFSDCSECMHCTLEVALRWGQHNLFALFSRIHTRT